MMMTIIIIIVIIISSNNNNNNKNERLTNHLKEESFLISPDVSLFGTIPV